MAYDFLKLMIWILTWIVTFNVFVTSSMQTTVILDIASTASTCFGIVRLNFELFAPLTRRRRRVQIIGIVSGHLLLFIMGEGEKLRNIVRPGCL